METQRGSGGAEGMELIEEYSCSSDYAIKDNANGQGKEFMRGVTPS